MAKYKALTEEEKQKLRERGVDPNGVLVNRLGDHARLFLILKTREEVYIPDIRR